MHWVYIFYAVGIVIDTNQILEKNTRLQRKRILKYLKRTRHYMLVYSIGNLGLLGYTNSDFQGILNLVKLHMKRT